MLTSFLSPFAPSTSQPTQQETSSCHVPEGWAVEDDARVILKGASNVPLNHRYSVYLDKDISGGLGITVKRVAEWGFVIIDLPESSVENDLSITKVEGTDHDTVLNGSFRQRAPMKGPAARAGLQVYDTPHNHHPHKWSDQLI